jgi:hypothetical protein
MDQNQIHPHQGWRFAMLLVLFSFLFFTPVAASSEPIRYVAPTGNDADNNCLAVRNPCATVSHAISQADPGDTIRIGPGVYTETNIRIDKSLTMAGHHTTNTFLQGAESMAAAEEPILIIGEDIIDQQIAVTVQNLTIRHGNHPSGSFLEGAITVGPAWGESQASLMLVGVAVEANRGSGIGVGYSGVLTLRRSRVSHNQGHGISGFQADISILENSKIVANGHSGVRVQEGRVVVEWSVIRDNSGDGVWTCYPPFGTQTIVRNSRILDNGGAAVWGTETDLYVADSFISGNGSGLDIQADGNITVSNSVIRGNNGHGISSVRSYAHVYNSIIENNQGDGIDHGNNQWYQLTVSDSMIRGNGGYGLKLWQTRGSVHNTSITGNQKGGLYVDREVQFTVYNSSIIRNRSNLNGGGVVNHGHLTLVNTVVSQNQAAQHGGGIYSAPAPGWQPPHDYSLQLTGVTVTHNHADILRNNTGNGGGIYNPDGSALTLLDTILMDNYDLSPTERHPNCSGGLTSLGGNTFGDLTGCTVIEE